MLYQEESGNPGVDYLPHSNHEQMVAIVRVIFINVYLIEFLMNLGLNIGVVEQVEEGPEDGRRRGVLSSEKDVRDVVEQGEVAGVAVEARPRVRCLPDFVQLGSI
jgi:hypothetical protein